jgi:outer membrane protein OmpA-like peptidoglycan-associated protein
VGTTLKSLGAFFLCSGLCWAGWPGPRVLAQENVAQRLSIRYTAGASLMMSGDQRSWLGYADPGLLMDLQLTLRVTQLVAAQAGVAGGVFFSPISAGALLAPLLGVTLHWPLFGLSSYVALNGGAAFTGNVARPFGRAAFGVDWPLSAEFSAGPVLGLDVVAQRDGQGYSDDAVYAWVGLGLSYHAVRSQPVMRRKPIEMPPPPPRPSAAALKEPSATEVPAREPVPPSPELAALIDEAAHVSHTELLAPVLFEYDSVELEPSSVAMLHEVARLLTMDRQDIQLMAVVAYADARGSEQYNLELSQRRAERVREWLVQHGVASERLTVEARGYAEPVETGRIESEHQQNRRVVFRVLREVRP